MRKLAIASVAVAALVLPAAAETTAPASAKQPLYVLGPGTRASASGAGSGDPCLGRRSRVGNPTDIRLPS